jgi:hypothetical protein
VVTHKPATIASRRSVRCIGSLPGRALPPLHVSMRRIGDHE